MKKRILSCLMALALCLTLLPTAAGGGAGGDGADAPGRGGIDRPGKRGSEAGKPACGP